MATTATYSELTSSGYDHADHVVIFNGPNILDNNSTQGGIYRNITRIIACGDTIPASWELFEVESKTVIAIIWVLWFCVAIILANFFEMLCFFIKHFKHSRRGRRTIYVLALTPIFAVCAILGVMVPRAGTLVDLLANAYFPTAMFSLHKLLQDYLGGRRTMRTCGITELSLSTPPCCCIFPCLPKVKLNRKTYFFIMMTVYQATIIRPLLMLIACVLWVDGSYIPGNISPAKAFVYLTILNNATSMLAIWGLLIVQINYKQYLKKYGVTMKFLYLQFILLGTSFGGFVFGMLVSFDVIKCTSFLPSSSRAQTLYHSYVIFLMLLISIWGRFAYRRTSDAPEFPDFDPGGPFMGHYTPKALSNSHLDRALDLEESQTVVELANLNGEVNGGNGQLREV